jgi:hypothetical protein
MFWTTTYTYATNLFCVLNILVVVSFAVAKHGAGRITPMGVKTYLRTGIGFSAFKLALHSAKHCTFIGNRRLGISSLHMYSPSSGFVGGAHIGTE